MMTGDGDSSSKSKYVSFTNFVLNIHKVDIFKKKKKKRMVILVKQNQRHPFNPIVWVKLQKYWILQF